MSCALVAFRCLAALLVCAGAWAQEIPIGGTLPNATLQGLNGPTRHLSDYRGKPLLINVWASWCGPCREEMASLERLAWLDKKPQFAIIGISTDDLAEHAASLLVRTNATIAHFIDSHLEMERLLGASRLPLTVLVNPDGRVLARVYGAKQWDQPSARQFVDSTFRRKAVTLSRRPQAANPVAAPRTDFESMPRGAHTTT